MADWRTFFGLESGCTDKCGNNIGPAPDNACESFAIDADGSNKEPGVDNLSCEDITKGFHCGTINFLGKLNAWIKGFLCWLSDHESRITQLENENPVIGWAVNDSDGDGVYDITVTFKDGTTTPFQIEDTDTRLTNPRPQDTDSNGINDQVLWDVIDDDGNVIGSEIVPIQEYVDTDTQSVVTGISYNQNNGVLTLTQTQGGTKTTTFPVASSGMTLVNNGNPVALWSTGEIPVSGLPDTYSANVSAHVPSSASGVIVRYYLEVDSTSSSIPVEINIRINGKFAGGTEAGGSQPVTDNSYWADMAFPRAGNNITAVIAMNYGANPAVYQTRGYLIGYF